MKEKTLDELFRKDKKTHQKNLIKAKKRKKSDAICMIASIVFFIIFVYCTVMMIIEMIQEKSNIFIYLNFLVMTVTLAVFTILQFSQSWKNYQICKKKVELYAALLEFSEE